jgi:hypothetical protein
MNLKSFLEKGVANGQTYKTLANKLNRQGYRTTTASILQHKRAYGLQDSVTCRERAKY